MTRTINFISAAIIFIAAFIPEKAAAVNPPFSPIRIEAENWTQKNGSQYATSTNDAGGGNQVVGITNGSWMEYSVNTGSSGAGNYTVTFRVATPQVHAQFEIWSGSTPLKTVPIPNSGEWNIWEDVTVNNVALAAGTQTLRIVSVNDETCNFNWMEFTLGGANQPPSANAGNAQTINLPTTSVTLSGSGSDAEGPIVSYAWSQVSGPNAQIQSPGSQNTSVTGMTVAGIRVFRLTVTDNAGATGTSDVSITVATSLAPSVDAGSNQTINLPTTQVTLTGTATPNNGGNIASTGWTQISGTAATIGSPNSLNTTITDLNTAGSRVFRLTATDNQGHPATSDVTITVVSTGGTANYWSLNTMNVFYNDGNVGIGTNSPQYKLTVKGAIAARRVKVTQETWADYVFEKTYRLPSLAEVEKYILQHKHLPDMPPAGEVEKQGLDLGENQSLLLKKIEELTLYVIEQNKRMEQQQKDIEIMKQQLKKIQEQQAGNKKLHR